ncbi:MAG: metalloregulator ArsR/SmtB family transcription factor [Parvularculaceae bacterium]
MRSQQLDSVFHALSDPTRRGMLEQLSRGEANVSALAKPHAMSQPAISKHLRVLERAGLITRTRKGREQFVRVNPKPMGDATAWIDRYAAYWRMRFDEVENYLREEGMMNDEH